MADSGAAAEDHAADENAANERLDVNIPEQEVHLQDLDDIRSPRQDIPIDQQ